MQEIQELCVGNGVKDQIIEQNVILTPLSLKKLQRFEELWPAAGDKHQHMYFLYISKSQGLW